MNIFDSKDDSSNKKTISGISCDVKNCTYNDGCNNCTAGHITVGPTNAVSCTDTVCATFKSN